LSGNLSSFLRPSRKPAFSCFVFFFFTDLLRYSLHSIKYIFCMSDWIRGWSRQWQTNLENLPATCKRCLLIALCKPDLPDLWCLLSPQILHKWNARLCIFHLVSFTHLFWDSSLWLHVIMLYSFLVLCGMPRFVFWFTCCWILGSVRFWAFTNKAAMDICI
jgi:hypothetical protein